MFLLGVVLGIRTACGVLPGPLQPGDRFGGCGLGESFVGIMR